MSSSGKKAKTVLYSAVENYVTVTEIGVKTKQISGNKYGYTSA